MFREAASLRLLVFLTSTLLLILNYQNCGRKNSASDDSYSFLNLRDATETISGSEKRNIVADCMSNPNYNACLFWKNPVAHGGIPLSQPQSWSTDLSDLQTQGFTIRGNDNGELENQHLNVAAEGDGQSANHYDRVQFVNGSYKFGSSSDPHHFVGQLQSYVWGNQLVKYMLLNWGSWYGANAQIKINSYFNNLFNAYWNGSRQNPKIIMGQYNSTQTGMGEEFALNGDLVVHELAHASLSYASGWAIYENDNTVGCRSNLAQAETKWDERCCSDRLGCAAAINEGQADFTAALLFFDPLNPAEVPLEETLTNSMLGLLNCNRTDFPRNPLALTDQSSPFFSAQGAFEGCQTDHRGEIHALGTFYASLWWNVRRRAAADSQEGQRDVETLFFEHLSMLNGTDTFESVLNIIKAIDSTYFGNRYYSYFESEWRARGI